MGVLFKNAVNCQDYTVPVVGGVLLEETDTGKQKDYLSQRS